METIYASGMDTGKDPDAALVGATKSGDTCAFETLVSRYKRRALAMAQRITNNREDAEDVVQESFHKAFLHDVFGILAIVRDALRRSEEHTSELQSPDHIVCR